MDGGHSQGKSKVPIGICYRYDALSMFEAFPPFSFSENIIYSDAAPEDIVFHGVINQVTQMIHSHLPRASFVLEKVILRLVVRKTRERGSIQMVVVASYAERLLI
jgi:hypothetical protein